MPLIAKRMALQAILRYLDAIPSGRIIRVENHKNDRFFEIELREECVLIVEDGYTKNEFLIVRRKARGVVSDLIRHEFPRSRYLRIKLKRPARRADLHLSPWSARKVR